MARLQNWRSRLHTYLASNAKRVFEPGQWDCSLFSAGGVEAITGTDPAAAYRGQYTTVAEGIALLQANGFQDHVAFVEANYEEKPVFAADVGDLATVEQQGEVGVGIVVGPEIAVITLRGLGLVPLSTAKRVFKV